MLDRRKIETSRQKVLDVLAKMEQNLPQETIPITTNEHLFQIGHLYSRIGEKEKFRSILNDLNNRENTSVEDKLKYGQAYIQELNDYETATGIFQELYNSYSEIENFVQTKGLKKAGLTQNSWDRWQRLYTEIISSLVLTYRSLEMWEPMAVVLEDWIARNPNDFNAQEMLKEIQNNITISDSGNVNTGSIFN